MILSHGIYTRLFSRREADDFRVVQTPVHNIWAPDQLRAMQSTILQSPDCQRATLFTNAMRHPADQILINQLGYALKTKPDFGVRIIAGFETSDHINATTTQEALGDLLPMVKTYGDRFQVTLINHALNRQSKNQTLADGKAFIMPRCWIYDSGPGENDAPPDEIFIYQTSASNLMNGTAQLNAIIDGGLAHYAYNRDLREEEALPLAKTGQERTSLFDQTTTTVRRAPDPQKRLPNGPHPNYAHVAALWKCYADFATVCTTVGVAPEQGAAWAYPLTEQTAPTLATVLPTENELWEAKNRIYPSAPPPSKPPEAEPDTKQKSPGGEPRIKQRKRVHGPSARTPILGHPPPVLTLHRDETGAFDRFVFYSRKDNGEISTHTLQVKAKDGKYATSVSENTCTDKTLPSLGHIIATDGKASQAWMTTVNIMLHTAGLMSDSTGPFAAYVGLADFHPPFFIARTLSLLGLIQDDLDQTHADQAIGHGMPPLNQPAYGVPQETRALLQEMGEGSLETVVQTIENSMLDDLTDIAAALELIAGNEAIPAKESRDLSKRPHRLAALVYLFHGQWPGQVVDIFDDKFAGQGVKRTNSALANTLAQEWGVIDAFKVPDRVHRQPYLQAAFVHGLFKHIDDSNAKHHAILKGMIGTEHHERLTHRYPDLDLQGPDVYEHLTKTLSSPNVTQELATDLAVTAFLLNPCPERFKEIPPGRHTQHIAKAVLKRSSALRDLVTTTSRTAQHTLSHANDVPGKKQARQRSVIQPA